MFKRSQIQFSVVSASRQVYEASQVIFYAEEPVLRFHITYKRGVPYLDVQTTGNVLYPNFQYELIRFLNQANKLIINRTNLMDYLF